MFFPAWRSLKTRVTVVVLAIFLISIWSLAFYASRTLREDTQRLLSEQLVAPQYRLIVTASDQRRVMEELPAPGINPAIDRNIQGFEGSDVYVNALGVEILTSIKRIPVAGWYMAVSISTAEAFAPIRDMQRRMLIAAIFLTLLAGALTWWMLSRQLAPMLAASKTLATLSDANEPPQPLPIARQDEIGELIGGFNRLVKALAQREKILKESEERYRTLFETMDEGFCVIEMIYDQDGKPADYRFLEINPAFMKQTGLTDALTKTMREMVPDHDAHWFEIYGKVARTGVAIRFASPAIAMQRYYDVFAFRVGGAASQRVGILFYDITERKRAEETQAKLAAIVESTTVAIVTRALDGTILTWNPGAQEMLGYTAAEAVGKSIAFTLPPGRPPNIARNNESVLHGEVAVARESDRITKDGRVITVLTSHSAIRDGAGNIVAVSVILQDITTRKQAEEQAQAAQAETQRLLALSERSHRALLSVMEDEKQAVAALRESESRFRTIIESSPVPYALNDDEQNITYLNTAFVQTFGYDPEDIPTLADWWPKAYPDAGYRQWVATTWQARLDKAKQAGIPFEPLELNIRCKDGTLRTAIVDVVSFGEKFKGVHLVILYDITERKRTEEALQTHTIQLQDMSRRLLETQETERRNVNRELHDRIGQNLAVLNLNFKLIRSGLPKDLPRAAGARLDDAQKLLEVTSAQVRDVMAELHPPALDDQGLFAALRAYAASFGAQSNTPVAVNGRDLSPRLPPAVEMALFRIAQEALANAAKHARAKHVEVMLAATAEKVTLTITDDGVGFDVAPAGPVYPSWGLSIMRERAVAAGATLRIESAPGKGTRACVEVARSS